MNLLFRCLLILLFSIEYTSYFGSVSPIASKWLMFSVWNVFACLLLFFFYGIIAPSHKAYYGISACLWERSRLKPVRSEDPIRTLLFLFLFYIGIRALSLPFAVNQSEGYVVLSRLLTCGILFFFLLELMDNRPSLILFSVRVVSCYALLNGGLLFTTFFTDVFGDRSVHLQYNVFPGHFGHENQHAFSFLMKMPFIVYGMYGGGRAWKVLCGVSLYVSVCSIFLILTRSVYVGFFVCWVIYIGGFFFLKSIPGLRKVIVFISMIFIASLITTQVIHRKHADLTKRPDSPTAVERIVDIRPSEDKSRLRLWGDTFEMIKEHPLLGCGPGNWKVGIMNHQRFQSHFKQNPRRAHNDFLEVTAESGIIGLIAFISIFIGAFVFFNQTIRSNIPSREKALSYFFTTHLIGYSVVSLFTFPMERPSHQIYLMLYWAIISLVYTETKKREGPRLCDSGSVHLFFRRCSYFLMFVMIVGSVWIHADRLRSGWYQRRLRSDIESGHLRLGTEWVDRCLSPFNTLSIWSTAPLHHFKGRYAVHRKMYREAIAYLEEAKKEHPFYAFNDLLIAICYTKLEMYDQAMEHLAFVETLKPNYGGLYKWRATIFFNQGAYEDALREINSAIEKNPKEQNYRLVKRLISRELNR